MTNKEAVIAFCSLEVPSNTVDLELINSSISGISEYNVAQKEQVARTACNVLSALLGLASFKEGDLTIAIDRTGIEKRILYLANQFGFTDLINAGKPQIRDRSDLW